MSTNKTQEVKMIQTKNKQLSGENHLMLAHRIQRIGGMEKFAEEEVVRTVLWPTPFHNGLIGVSVLAL